MSGANRVNRKATDGEIVRLNSLGLSLSRIGKILDCHPTTITLRLKSLNIEPADTRRTFMEDVVLSFSEKQQEALADKLGPHLSVKDYVRNLIAKDLIS
jgi:hypothetical protein